MSATLDRLDVGRTMHDMAAELFPIFRSITGDGVRQTLARIAREIPLEVEEVPSGTPVFDWTVPKEWNVREAWIADARGERVVDLADSNLHLVSYSVPVRKRVSAEELREHVFTLPEQPELIPYRTSYYNETWGFCLSQAQLDGLTDPEYDVCIDTTLEDGHLTYGECHLPGEVEDEVLVSCHVCHPSLANDNLSGIAVATETAKTLMATPHRHSYRFVFLPATIGAITWLARNEERLAKIRHGLVLTGVGDPGASTYKRSRRGDAEVDQAAAHVLAHSGEPYDLQDFFPYGYDERQYCSPGFDLPVGCLMRTPHGRYPEYHTSADDLDFVRPEKLADSLAKVLAICSVLDRNTTYVNLEPKCEPQLGKRGLYEAIGGDVDKQRSQLAMLWVLNQSDGTNSLLDIAERSGLAFDAIEAIASVLRDHGLLAEAPR